ncbi:MAG: PAS domain S-box protein, partial [Candidatus Binatus sp.]|uniref:PAS domain S-box protein n=1 Tax=Candidatus Binatus sp. TaxID=2811406 RepID=UPI00271862E5
MSHQFKDPVSRERADDAVQARNSVISDQWVVRMIQSCSMLMILSAVFLLTRFYQEGRLGVPWLALCLLANLAMGFAALALTTSSRFVRNWQPLSLTMAMMVTAADATLGLVGGEPIPLFIILMLNMAVTGSLLPWSMAYQASFNLVCLAVWVAQLVKHPQGDKNEAFRMVGLLTAAALAQFSCYLRRRYYTEREESEGRLRESESAMRQIFDSNTDAITITDAATRRIAAVNAEFVRSIGYMAAETIGKTPLELVACNSDIGIGIDAMVGVAIGPLDGFGSAVVVTDVAHQLAGQVLNR